jgi:hypothetical protein
LIYEPIKLRFAQFAADALVGRLSKNNAHIPRLNGKRAAERTSCRVP